MAKNQLGRRLHGLGALTPSCWIWGLQRFTVIRNYFEAWLAGGTGTGDCWRPAPCSSCQLLQPGGLKSLQRVAASFISMSPNLERGSRLRVTTEPIAVPSQMMGAITWAAVIPSGSSSTSGMYA